MITYKQRADLSRRPVPDKCIGYDCEGQIIEEGDIVEVIREDENRIGSSNDWTFCSVGKRGHASRHYCFPAGWCVIVKFEGGQTVGCVDMDIRKV